MEKDCIDEVIALHRFFETWLSGKCAQSQQNFTRLRDSLDEQFQMITPGGVLVNRKALCEQLWQAHGSAPAEFKIEIKKAVCRQLGETLAIVNYQEWQTGNDQTCRISSAIIRKERERLIWIQVHETWVQEH